MITGCSLLRRPTESATARSTDRCTNWRAIGSRPLDSISGQASGAVPRNNTAGASTAACELHLAPSDRRERECGRHRVRADAWSHSSTSFRARHDQPLANHDPSRSTLRATDQPAPSPLHLARARTPMAHVEAHGRQLDSALDRAHRHRLTFLDQKPSKMVRNNRDLRIPPTWLRKS